ncbi:MAG TPA: hypothetical protein VIZ22_11980 [Candidatus Limnocylindrales bacterium]
MKRGKSPERILSGGVDYVVKADELPIRLPSGGVIFTVVPDGVDREQAMIVWRMWRGSPELLAHAIRVAERVTGATETFVDVTVRNDHELFASSKEFLDDVTVDALRNFTAIRATVRGREVKVDIRLEWLAGDNNAQVVATASGPREFPEREAEALTAIHHAIERGGTHRERTQRLFQWSVQALFLAAFFLISVAAYLLVSISPIPGWLAGTPLAPLASEEGLTTIVTSICVLVSATLAVWFGRRAYPSLEVAEGGETRLWRHGRKLGGFVVASAITIGIAVYSGG